MKKAKVVDKDLGPGRIRSDVPFPGFGPKFLVDKIAPFGAESLHRPAGCLAAEKFGSGFFQIAVEHLVDGMIVGALVEKQGSHHRLDWLGEAGAFPTDINKQIGKGGLA
jgi:hypothetical protein